MTTTTPSTEVRRQIALQCQHIAALERLHALKHMAVWPVAREAEASGKQIIKVDMAGAKAFRVPTEEILSHLEQIARIANFPVLMNDRSVRLEDLQVPANWCHPDFHSFSGVATSLTSWRRGGYESFHHAAEVLPENEILQTSDSVSHLRYRLLLPAEHFLLRTNRAFMIDSNGKEVKLDTFICNMTVNGIVINTIPRIEDSDLNLVNEKKMKSLIAKAKGDYNSAVNAEIEAEIGKVSGAYGHWLPGITVMLRGSHVYDGYGIRLRARADQFEFSPSASISLQMNKNNVRHIAESIARIFINEVSQLMKTMEAIEYARREQAKPRSDRPVGSARNAALQVFEPEAHFLIGPPKYLNALKQSTVRGVGDSKRASPMPHPRYLPKYHRLDGSVRPDRFRIGVNGWTPEEHGHPAGRLVVIKS